MQDGNKKIFKKKKIYKMKRNNSSICIIDYGTYIAWAIHLTKYFNKVYYFSDWKTANPRIELDNVGTGIEGVERISNLWDYIDDIDYFVFAHLYQSDLGEYLRSIGKKVWGASPSEILEIDRILFYEELEKIGLPVVKYEAIKGVNNLKEYLSDKKDKYIKVSKYRGDFESYHHVNINLTNIFLDDLSKQIGILKNEIEFIVQDKIDAVVEVGGDFYSVDGKYPKNIAWGVEQKDSSFCEKTCSYDEMPKELKTITDKFASVLKEYKHNGTFCQEVRITESGESYFTDPVICRFPLPPTFLSMNLISNWDEIFIGGCEGMVVEPKYAAKYGAEILLKTDYAGDNWCPVYFPKEIENNVKLQLCLKRKDTWYVIPSENIGVDMKEIGSCTGLGTTPEEALRSALEVAKQVETVGIRYDEGVLEKNMETIKNMEKHGIFF